ncbi:glutamyl-trna amidotransferase subunit a [Moniliophthora roreri MCA 2997]|uniref:Glutamyl-trna amidotransferase subunit a n=2 Tax=Moniliophthora roreri TaxID=221103 RepID=V2YGU0_MONRO|nr:glutamyl-trna amidotransferase subunit a [Moniliophthora roreri MCA 2997]
MSYSKPATLSRLTDATLGCFSRLPQSEFLDHLIRFLSTWSGSDKFFNIIQCIARLLAAYLSLRARLQHRAGLRPKPVSNAAVGCTNFARVVSRSRTLYRFWGLMHIVQWMGALERSPQPTRSLLNIERLQGWSMLGYYPLEHLSFLRSNDIIPSQLSARLSPLAKPKQLNIDAGELSLWSCRCWAAYVVLQFAHLREQRKLLQTRQRNLRKAKGSSLSRAEKEELKKSWEAYWNGLILNVANFALALNDSSRTGIMGSVWYDLLTLFATALSFKSGWEATALPSQPQTIEEPTMSEATAVGYDATLNDGSQ